ncbi:MAG: bifunctional precorrin-2 dehydrogenase/sirohydrochlorin ferrochelatase [Peptoniphilus sp.]|nr:bifunctional precorrin-2 dehydrogenase/sirohydrochlorin ferrochelatase [Peptoniphilus sp.]MDY3118001.1 bifunctional precorrin-2 dehydrogenase/sirohydrochlorin ferrochelatase [Peptoniphilus sp.]
MRYFPLMIDTHGKKVLIVGGGKAATLKIKGLMNSSFVFYCLSPAFDDDLLALKKKCPDRLFLKQMSVTCDFRFFAYDFLIAATDNDALNAALLHRAKLASVPALSVSNSEESDFHTAPILTRGPLAVSISTNNPTVTKHIKDDLDEFLSRYDPKKLVEMNRIRALLVERKSEHIAAIMDDLWQEEKITKEHWEDRNDTTGGNARK